VGISLVRWFILVWIYAWAVWQDHKVSLFLAFWGTTTLVALVYSSTNIVCRFRFPMNPHQHLLLFVFLLIANQTGVRWNLLVKDVEQCFHVFISHFNFFWEVYVQFICPFITGIICSLAV
jgi:hypothetical protein